LPNISQQSFILFYFRNKKTPIVIRGFDVNFKGIKEAFNPALKKADTVFIL